MEIESRQPRDGIDNRECAYVVLQPSSMNRPSHVVAVSQPQNLSLQGPKFVFDYFSHLCLFICDPFCVFPLPDLDL